MASFQSLLEQDKERFLSLLSQNTSTVAIIKDVEAEFDRLLYSFNNENENDAVKDAARQMIQTAKSTATFIDTAGETKLWQKTAYGAKPEKGKRSFFFWIFLLLSFIALGGYCVYQYSLMRMPFKNLPDYLPFLLLLPIALFFFISGITARRRTLDKSPDLEAEVSTDIQKVYRSVLSAVLVIDRNLEDIRTEERIQLRKQMKEHKDSLDKEEIDLLAHILESAYSTKQDDSSVEMISQIKYYLHNKKIEVVDYSDENSAWFDFIPAYDEGTIRPAFVIEGMLIKKGLASGGNK